MYQQRLLIRAAMVADAEGRMAAPGAVLLHGPRILAAGAPADIGVPADAQLVDVPEAVVVPSLVNAHSHLDLSHIAPRPYSGDFVQWIQEVRTRRALDDHAIAASVRLGIELARAGGTAVVGDIAGLRSSAPMGQLRAAGLVGVSFLEVFGLGTQQQKAISGLLEALGACPAGQDGMRAGVSPHAPYSCGLEVYRAAAGLGLPLATHLAETPEELQLMGTGDGPLAAFLRGLGLWDDTFGAAEQHPIDHIAEALATAPCIAAHVNYIEARHLAMLAGWKTTVAYCPRASAYFGHAPHQYRDMLAAGVNVALGTDGLLCLDTPDRISILDEMRFLYLRDGTDPMTLLRMGTTAGALALGVDPSLVTLAPGPTAGLLAAACDPHRSIDPLRQVLQRDDPPRWIVRPTDGRSALHDARADESIAPAARATAPRGEKR